MPAARVGWQTGAYRLSSGAERLARGRPNGRVYRPGRAERWRTQGLATRDHLKRWADRIDVNSRFPSPIRRLILESGGKSAPRAARATVPGPDGSGGRNAARKPPPLGKSREQRFYGYEGEVM